MSSKNLYDLAEICADALAAFSLVLASDDGAEDELTSKTTIALISGEEIEPALSLLKRDEFSLVVKVRCERTNIYVLKCVNAELYFGSEETAQVQNSLMQFSGAERLRAADGSYLFHQILPGGTHSVWSLSRFVPNAPSFDWLDVSPSWTEAQSHSAGSMLALLHHRSHLNSAKFSSAPFSDLTSVISSIPQWLKQAFADGEPFSNDPSRSASSAASSSNQGEIAASNQALILEKIKQCIADLKRGKHEGAQIIELHQIILGEEKLMIHGDFHPGNVLFINDQAVCAIDWDYAHLENPLLELAYGMVMFSGKFALSGHNSLDQAIAHAFLQGYSAGCRNSGWSVYRTVSGLHVNASTNQHEVDCDTDVLRILLRPYIKLAASLILLWALSKQGRQQEHQSQIVLKATHLILSDLDQKSLDRGA